jgi:cyclopropane-fatty-acyl-phospholipid synthase
MTKVRTSSLSEWVVRRMCRSADVVIDGARPWDLQVVDERFFPTVVRQGSLGFGESYLQGWWYADDVEELVYRLIRTGFDRLSRALPAQLAAFVVAAFTNQQTPTRSTVVADRHYNLGNDLFFGFLGSYRNYSCAYFDDTASLDAAQLRKMDVICRKLSLTGSDHLLDVGGGWGQFAHYAATQYGCRVTSINIADEQLRYAAELCRGLPVEVRKCDYRKLSGTYSKIAVIAMLTHVGPRNYRQFMHIMHRCLDDDGLMLVETLGSRFANRNCEPWINKYIFPGGVIPSLRQIGRAVDGRFLRTDLEEFGRYYVPTLRAWHANLMASWPALSNRYPETTRLMLEYFFLSVAGAFRAERLKYWHLVMAKKAG